MQVQVWQAVQYKSEVRTTGCLTTLDTRKFGPGLVVELQKKVRVWDFIKGWDLAKFPGVQCRETPCRWYGGAPA